VPFEQSIDDHQSLEALNALSSFYHTNNTTNRRALRSDMESRAMEYNRKFLYSFDLVNQVRHFGTFWTNYLNHVDLPIANETGRAGNGEDQSMLCRNGA
jgi:hypothetical protein